MPGDVGGSIDCGEGQQSEWGASSGGGGSAAAAEASSGSGDYWDWGMGWGWSGNSASYCQSCALEHAVVMSNQQQVRDTHPLLIIKGSQVIEPVAEGKTEGS